MKRMALSSEVERLFRERAYHNKKLREVERQLEHWVEYGEVKQLGDWLLTPLERAVGALVDAALARLERYRRH